MPGPVRNLNQHTFLERAAERQNKWKEDREEEDQLRSRKYKKRGTLFGSVEKSVAEIARLTLGTSRYSSSKALPVVSEKEPDSKKPQLKPLQLL